MASDRNFLVGTTVVLTVSVSQPGTRVPVNPSAGCTLDALKVGNLAVTAPAPATFTNVSVGEYEKRLDTVGWQAGIYTWRAKVTDVTLGTALKEDTFVLRALA